MDIDLHLGDCLDIMKDIPSDSIDGCITSPPYFNAKDYSHWETYGDYLSWMGDVTSEINRILKPGRCFCLNISCVIQPRKTRSDNSKRLAIPYHMVGICERNGFEFRDDIIWEKPEGACFNRGQKFSKLRTPILYRTIQVTEFILVFIKNGKSTDELLKGMDRELKERSKVIGDYERTNVWKFNPETRSKHPAPFPEILSDNLVKYYTFDGDTVIDPFMGSGTTGVSCIRFNRNFIGCEKDETYFNMAKDRLNGIPTAQ